MIEVRLEESDRLDWALKRFKKKVSQAGILQELRRKRRPARASPPAPRHSTRARLRSAEKPSG